MNRQQRRADAKANPTAKLLNTAIQHHLAGQLDQATKLYSKILQADPNHADAIHLLGVIAHQLGRNEDSVDLISMAININKLDPAFHCNLGNAFRSMGRLEESLSAQDTALSLNPNYAEAHNNRGSVLHDMLHIDWALAAYDTALSLKPNYIDAHFNRGNALRELGRFDDALTAYNTALSLDPNHAQAYVNRGNVFKDQGRMNDALCDYDAALRVNPNFDTAHSTKLLSLHYETFDSYGAIAEQARAFGASVSHTNAFRCFANTAIPNRRLRIGYVSGDLRRHPVGYFLQSILRNHDHNAVEVFCYSNNIKDDDLTACFQSQADHWRRLQGVTDLAAAKIIQTDAIDILVDLSGHTNYNRLPLFAHKPAPVQVSWLGYFGTTGLTTMDYVLADRFVVPPGEEDAFSEQIWRMPNSYLCFIHPDMDMPVQRAAQPITFGSFNNLAKMSPHTVSTWAQILQRVPQSRLLLKTSQLADAAVCQTVQQRFAQHGIQPHRLVLEGPALRADLLASYSRVDIALDPYPYGGGTTTAEALWMGTPVVTLRGKTWTGRVSESILSTVGLTDLVADSQQEYVDLAVKLACDQNRLDCLHNTLRSRVAASPFCDGVGFTRQLEDAFRSMWKRWCEDEPL